MARLYVAPDAPAKVQEALERLNRREFSFVHVHCIDAFASVSFVILTPGKREALRVAVAAIGRDWPERTVARVNDRLDTARNGQLNIDVYPRTYVRDAVERVMREPHKVYWPDGHALAPQPTPTTATEV